MPENLASLANAFSSVPENSLAQRQPTEMKNVGFGIEQYTPGGGGGLLDPFSEMGKMLSSLSTLQNLKLAPLQKQKLEQDIAGSKGQLFLKAFEELPKIAFTGGYKAADAYAKQVFGPEAGVTLRFDPATNKASGFYFNLPQYQEPIAFGGKGVLTPQETLNQTMNVAENFYKFNKVFVEQYNELNKLQNAAMGGIQARRDGKSPAPYDMALLTGVIRANSPGIVDQREFERARATIPILDKALNDLDRIRNRGAGFLTDQGRQDYIDWAQNMRQTVEPTIKQNIDTYSRVGAPYGIDRTVFNQFLQNKPATPHYLDQPQFGIPVAPGQVPVKPSEDLQKIFQQNLFRRPGK